jgi:hypothetical protein
MERGNAKHGPRQDEELTHETEPIVRGTPQRAHAEEWRETEPLDGADPVAARPEAASPRPGGRDIELRSELARLLTRDAFPADRDILRGRLADADAPPDLVGRVGQLPGGRQFGDVHQVLEALGINSPETRSEHH